MLKLLVSVSNFWFLLGWSSCTKLLQTTVQLPDPVTTQPTNTKLELVCQSLSRLLACYGNSSAIILPGTNFPERGLWAGMADGNRINQPIIGSGVSVGVGNTHHRKQISGSRSSHGSKFCERSVSESRLVIENA